MCAIRPRRRLVGLAIAVGCVAFISLAAPPAQAAEPVVGNYHAKPGADGMTQNWMVTGEPIFWKIKIVYFDKAGQEIGSAHAATATRKGKSNDVLDFVIQWDKKPDPKWPDYPKCVMKLDEKDKDKATFTTTFRKQEIQTGELERVK
ncbi:MAG TPA: hypothetical protein VFE24_03455 [Pirellulales bacterium]|jgi:hypothetical protein|nr:hypothetical protein [Pirellulales bacterium]